MANNNTPPAPETGQSQPAAPSKPEPTPTKPIDTRFADWLDPDHELPVAERNPTATERAMIQAVMRGRVFKASGFVEEPNHAAKAGTWGKERDVRAQVIEWLCKDLEACKLIPDAGIMIRGVRVVGELDLGYVHFGRPLALIDCAIQEGVTLTLSRFHAIALSGSHVGKVHADGMKVEGSVLLDKGFKASGEVRLLAASIDGNLECIDGEFQNVGKDALSADRMNVEGNVLLRQGFKASGGVRLSGASIGGNLECDGGEFKNEAKDALSADGMKVAGGVFLRNDFKASGEVRLLGASIGGNLDCIGGEFKNKGKDALSADGLTIDGSVFLRDKCQFDGRISFVAARLERDFQFRVVTAPEKAILDLRKAKVRTLWIGKKDRPAKDRCYLHGLVFDSIDDDMPTDSDWWIDLIERQTSATPESIKKAVEAESLRGLNAPEAADKRQAEADKARLFLPQPYEQAAKVLREQGHAEAAKEILIAKEKRRRVTIHPMDAWGLDGGSRWERLMRFVSLGTQWIWYRFPGPLLGFGFRPSLAFWAALVWITAAACLFSIADHRDAMIPLQAWALKPGTTTYSRTDRPPAYPKFQPTIYAVETFTPLIKLRQADYWHADPKTWTGFGVRGFTWLHTVFGWVLTTLLAAALTGILRR